MLSDGANSVGKPKIDGKPPVVIAFIIPPDTGAWVAGGVLVVDVGCCDVVVVTGGGCDVVVVVEVVELEQPTITNAIIIMTANGNSNEILFMGIIFLLCELLTGKSTKSNLIIHPFITPYCLKVWWRS